MQAGVDQVDEGTAEDVADLEAEHLGELAVHVGERAGCVRAEDPLLGGLDDHPEAFLACLEGRFGGFPLGDVGHDGEGADDFPLGVALSRSGEEHVQDLAALFHQLVVDVPAEPGAEKFREYHLLGITARCSGEEVGGPATYHLVAPVAENL